MTLEELEGSQLVQVSYRLARAFGWTPQQVQEMTMGQVSVYLQLLQQESEGNNVG